jgi:hypothetical protein
MSFRQRHRIPDLGVGVGFRAPHAEKILREKPPMDWFEIISENFMIDAPRSRAEIDQLAAAYRVVPHGVSMSIGGELDEEYLRRLKALVKRLDPPWCSDHLCWSGADGVDVHDLLPLPYTREAMEHVIERVKRVQGTLEVPFALENVSSYLTYRHSAMKEHEFLSEIAEKADCGILLDVNNVFVSAFNHKLQAEEFIDGVPADRVVQIHLAGHSDKGTYLLDTHSDHVREEVWALYRRAVQRLGKVTTLIEWDVDVPEWEVLSAEADQAREAREAACT